MTRRMTVGEFKARIAGKPRVRSKATAYGGFTFVSKLEADWAAILDQLKAANMVASWEPQVRFSMVIGGVKVLRYTADFLVTRDDGFQCVVECKACWKNKRTGRIQYANERWPMVARMFAALYPSLPLFVVTKAEVPDYLRAYLYARYAKRTPEFAVQRAAGSPTALAVRASDTQGTLAPGSPAAPRTRRASRPSPGPAPGPRRTNP